MSRYKDLEKQRDYANNIKQFGQHTELLKATLAYTEGGAS